MSRKASSLLAMQQVSGHVFRVQRTRGPAWYAKYRLPSGRQVQKKLGPAWTERGRPPAGYYTKRTAEAWLRAVMDEARRGTLPGMVRTGETLSDAAAEWLRYCEHERACKPSTLTEYRHTAERIARELGDVAIEDVTPEMLERWKAKLSRSLSNRSVAKYLVILHGIFKRAIRSGGCRGAVADASAGDGAEVLAPVGPEFVFDVLSGSWGFGVLEPGSSVTG